jgi:hypothetical protein
MLSANNSLARYEGLIAQPGQTIEAAAVISSANFALVGGSARIGFHLQGTSGGLDPAALTVRDGLGAVVTPIFSRDDVQGGNASLMIVDLAAGSYELDILGESGTTGAYRLDLLLVGDADGNRQVNSQDANLIRTAFGAELGEGNYLSAADADLDGRIGSFDLAQWVRNRGETTSVDANWGISLNTSPLSVVLTDGSLGTTLANVSVVGTTVPGRTVRLEADGDGQFDEGMAVAGSNGEYAIPTMLVDGLNTLSVQTADNFGQTRTNTLAVSRVASVPEFAQVFDNLATDRSGGGSMDVGVQRMATFDVDPGWEKVGTQTFGFSNTNQVGLGAGVMGGRVIRNPLSYYADTVDELDPRTDSLLLMGTAVITADAGGGNFLLGWFDKDSNLNWAPQHFLGMRSDGTNIYLLANGSNTVIGSVAIGVPFTFEVNYDANVQQLRGRINGGTEVVQSVAASQINPFDRFGLLNLQIAGGTQNQTVYFDNLNYTARSAASTPPDPSFWEGYRNRLFTGNPPLVQQNFGYSAGTNHAGGTSAGEIGGNIARTIVRSYYAKPIETKTFNDSLSVSGKFSLDNDSGGAGTMIGWFHDDLSTGWRTPSSIAMRLDGNGSTFQVLFEYGTQNAFMGGAPVLVQLPANGASHTFELTYNPAGNGSITLKIDNTHVGTLNLTSAHRSHGAIFNRFGIWNVQIAGGDHDVFFDDLVIDGVAENFSTNPGWEGSNNQGSFPQPVVRPLHDFGYSPTTIVSDDFNELGEIGGVTFRDERPTAYYAVNVGTLSLNQRLDASGKMVFAEGSSRVDSAVYIGWFDSETRQAYTAPNGTSDQPNFLGALIEGPSRYGHGFRPGYGNANGQGLHLDPEISPRLLPDGTTHDWEIHYNPAGNGRITVVFDGQTVSLNLASGHKAAGATFDRFGLFILQVGGHHVETYWDDLRFTANTAAILGLSAAGQDMPETVATIAMGAVVAEPSPQDAFFTRLGRARSDRTSPERLEVGEVNAELLLALARTDIAHSRSIADENLRLIARNSSEQGRSGENELDLTLIDTDLQRQVE